MHEGIFLGPGDSVFWGLGPSAAPPTVNYYVRKYALVGAALGPRPQKTESPGPKNITATIITIMINTAILIDEINANGNIFGVLNRNQISFGQLIELAAANQCPKLVEVSLKFAPINLFTDEILDKLCNNFTTQMLDFAFKNFHTSLQKKILSAIRIYTNDTEFGDSLRAAASRIMHGHNKCSEADVLTSLEMLAIIHKHLMTMAPYK